MSNFKELRTQNISHGVIASTFEDQQATIDLTSPALTVINNFTQKTPIRAQYDTPISEALKQVLAEHSDYVLVTDDAQKLIYVIKRNATAKNSSIWVTTRAAAARRGDTIPPVFIADK